MQKILYLIRRQGGDESDISQILEIDDIFTQMDDITELKSYYWTGFEFNPKKTNHS